MGSRHERCVEGGALSAAGEPAPMRRLVLVGGGRAHLGVLHALARRVVRGAEVVLVSDDRESFHPSMAAALLRGDCSLGEARIDLVALADRAGARVVTGSVSRIEVEQRHLLSGTERIPFDVCSFDAVGWPEGADLPGVVEHALPLRPTSALPGVREAVESRLSGSAGRIDCVVVGAGRTGVEAAFSMQQRLRGHASGGVVTLVDGATTILAGESPCRDVAVRELQRDGVCFALGSRVIEVKRDGVVLASGAMLPADLVLWATPGASPPVIAESGLPHDARGRLLVDEWLRSRDGAPVWAAGDCAALEAPGAASHTQTLVRSLRSALAESDVGARGSERDHPCLLDTGDGRAIVGWGPIEARSRLGGWLRRRRDRQYVAELARP